MASMLYSNMCFKALGTVTSSIHFKQKIIYPPYIPVASHLSPSTYLSHSFTITRLLSQHLLPFLSQESDGTSCPLSDPWDDFTSTGEVYLGGVSSEDAPIQDDGEPGLGELHLGEARRWSERIYPGRGISGDHPSPQHRSKRKKSKQRRHSKVSEDEVARERARGVEI